MNYQNEKGNLWFELSANGEVAFTYHYQFLKQAFTEHQEVKEFFYQKKAASRAECKILDRHQISYDLACELISMINDSVWLENINHAYYEG